jgi:hypothetical protein
MDIRDAVEADAGRLAELTDSPTDVMENLIHDRTVRVAQRADADADDPEAIVGFVSFDAREQTVHVTQLEGSADTCARLLEEPIQFATGENMAVELLVPNSEDTLQDAVDKVGFDRVGSGPRFEGTPTVKYRLEA